MTRRVDENPVTRKRDWFPLGLNSDLDELHDEHNARVEALADAQAYVAEVRERFETEDRDRVEAFKRGDEFEVTPEAERTDARNEAFARLKAAQEALADFVDAAIDRVQEQYRDWLADLNSVTAEAERKREEAARLLAEADQAVASVQHSRDWIERTARDRHGWHISFEGLPVRGPMPGRDAQFDTLMRARAGE